MEESVFVRYYKKFGERIGIPMGLPDWDKYKEELERCIESGEPFNGRNFFEPLPDGCVI